MSYRASLVYAAAILIAGCSDNGHALPPVVASTDLGCSGSRADPPKDLTVFFDSVALPTSDHRPEALQTGAQGEFTHDRAGRLFAKTGLWFKPGKAFELIVPDELRDRLSIGWASPRSSRVVVGECGDVPREWVVLPGGYWVADPLCAELIVRSGDAEQRVSIGLGAPCPGQAPPPQPSDV